MRWRRKPAPAPVNPYNGTQERGLYVSPRGYIVAAVQYPSAEWALKRGVPANAPRKGKDKQRVATSYVAVWDKDGRLLTANAVGDMQNGHGVAMDYDGNIYAAMGGCLPVGRNTLVGLSNMPVGKGSFSWGHYGSLLKFRGGIPFLRARNYYNEDVPTSALKVHGYLCAVTGIEGVNGSLLWMHSGLACQRAATCTCHHVRYDMDYFARHWIPVNYLYSLMVLDSNANIIARIGRYGKVDDEGIRFIWPRAVAVSDRALYVADPSSRRIFKATLLYHVEETVPLQ